MENKNIHYQIKCLVVNLVDSPYKTNKKLDVIALKNNITKHWYHYVIHLIVHLMVRFISDYKNINYYNGKY